MTQILDADGDGQLDVDVTNADEIGLWAGYGNEIIREIESTSAFGPVKHGATQMWSAVHMVFKIVALVRREANHAVAVAATATEAVSAAAHSVSDAAARRGSVSEDHEDPERTAQPVLSPTSEHAEEEEEERPAELPPPSPAVSTPTAGDVLGA